MKNNYAVIMAGGIGSRFWPMSQSYKPKQFLDVLGLGSTLIQMTYERLINSCPQNHIFVVTNKAYQNLVQEQLPEVPERNILVEPERKNTAPCIAYAAHKIYSINPEAIIVVAPSDHLITESERFNRIIEKARNEAYHKDSLVTIGIKPSRPDTGYGYIQFNKDEGLASGSAKIVQKFTEKPNREMAELFLKSGDYYWNSGIFVWKAKAIIQALEKFKPELNKLFAGNQVEYNADQEQNQINTAFENAENISIDFAILESANNVMVVLADFGWSDLGTWSSLHEELGQDFRGNAIQGQNTHTFDCKNNIIKLSDDRLAVIQGLNDFIVVEDNGVLLIMEKSDEQNIKKYMELAQKESPDFF